MIWSIIRRSFTLAGSYNGSTRDSGSRYLGSSPSPAALRNLRYVILQQMHERTVDDYLQKAKSSISAWLFPKPVSPEFTAKYERAIKRGTELWREVQAEEPTLEELNTAIDEEIKKMS